jgi:hypothetical protein
MRGDSARAGNGLDTKAEIARDVPKVAAPTHCATDLGTCHEGDTCRSCRPLSSIDDIDLVVVVRDVVASDAGLGRRLKALAGVAKHRHSTQARPSKEFTDVVVIIAVELLRCGIGCVEWYRKGMMLISYDGDLSSIFGEIQ